MRTKTLSPLVSLLTVFLILSGYLAGSASAQQATPISVATPVEPASDTGAVDLDVLFIGAHPDDEAGNLSTFGQWNEFDNINVGVITVTRGEGGGNAVGTEEGPALGLIRENEERNAVGMAGVDHIYNLDKVDFYYTVSAPLTEETWGYDDTLARVVRVIRETRPEIIVTMNPSPTPGNHGHHQMAARFAIDGFYAAADPARFPEQMSDEGLSTWRPSRIFRSGADGEGTPGPDCATSFVPDEPTDEIYGVWSGTPSEANPGTTWAQIERTAQKTYASQGWAAFPDADTDPALLECNYYTLIDSRVPMPADPAATTAILENAVSSVSPEMPDGTEFYLTSGSFTVQPGVPFQVVAHVSAGAGNNPASMPVSLKLPDGWELTTDDATAVAPADGTPVSQVGTGESIAVFGVVPSADAKVNTRFMIGAQVGNATTQEVVQVSPPVTGVLAPLPGVAQFRDWVKSVGAPQLDSLILPVESIGVGMSKDIEIALVNNSGKSQSGTVTLELPAGFEADNVSKPFGALAADAGGTITFTVSNTDTALKTSNEGGDEGSYPVSITTESGGESSVQAAALNLVPVTTVPQAGTPPVVDGALGSGEYSGEPIDLSRVWEGDDPESAADASGSAQLTWTEDGVYIAVSVTDDTLGAVLDPADAKRHWRTDSVEIAIDPLGTAPNTSSTFKVGEFPTTTSGEPAASRDADAMQGPVDKAAPGFEIASTVSEPYTGYVMESFIPFSDLPADIDPDNAAINIFIYDSDTQDLTGQSRLGWSTWNGVQGDPYRWGKAMFDGYQPPADARTEAADPVMPLDVAQSTDSPQSIAQSANDGVGLAGRPSVTEVEQLSVEGPPAVSNGKASVTLAAGSDGVANVFLVDDAGVVAGTSTVELTAGMPQDLEFNVGDATSGTLYIGFETRGGSVQALDLPVPAP